MISLRLNLIHRKFWSVFQINVGKAHNAQTYHTGAETNVRHFADDTIKGIFLNKNVRITIDMSLKFVPKVRINNILPGTLHYSDVITLIPWIHHCRQGRDDRSVLHASKGEGCLLRQGMVSLLRVRYIQNAGSAVNHRPPPPPPPPPPTPTPTHPHPPPNPTHTHTHPTPIPPHPHTHTNKKTGFWEQSFSFFMYITKHWTKGRLLAIFLKCISWLKNLYVS